MKVHLVTPLGYIMQSLSFSIFRDWSILDFLLFTSRQPTMEPKSPGELVNITNQGFFLACFYKHMHSGLTFFFISLSLQYMKNNSPPPASASLCCFNAQNCAECTTSKSGHCIVAFKLSPVSSITKAEYLITGMTLWNQVNTVSIIWTVTCLAWAPVVKMNISEHRNGLQSVWICSSFLYTVYRQTTKDILTNTFFSLGNS